MKKVLFLLLAFIAGITLQAQVYRFNSEPDGFSISSKNSHQLTLRHNLSAVTIESSDREGLEGQFITLSGMHIANQAGAPNLPSGSTFVAIPNGAKPSIRLVRSQTKTIKNIDLIPAPQPQLDNDNSTAVYEKDMSIYNRNAFYPSTPYQISEVMTVRGVEMVEVGVMPFQYNPVTKELIVYEDLELELTHNGGDGSYGDLRYRTPEWDQILSDMLLNHDVLPEVDYGERRRKHYENRETGCEYMIITPDNEDFISLADSIKQFRTEQGIPTEIFTVSECGGNDYTVLRSFIRNAYNSWDMPPAAVLILGDHNTDGTQGIVSYTMNNHPGGDSYNPYISDHAYSVMGNNHMPDIILGRITGRNYDEMYHMIKKDLDYERTPPTDPYFYDHPITAMGFQLERWFQLCSEVVNGFWTYELGKHPVRQNAIYQGTPGSRWSTYEYTNTVLNYFGPSGCGYIPQTMSHLTDWSANGNSVNEAINSGAFLIQHRDHGAEEVWGEPSYGTGYIRRLTNPNLTYVMSNNCLTGRFNFGGTDGDGCFAEVFHRHQYGALGLIAATQVSYSFVNDIYVWGAYDNMWPNFLPTYGTQHETNFVRPAFGNAAGKFFLRQSSWTEETWKLITYYLFHQHGDVYMTLYTEVPQELNVTMLPVLPEGSDQYIVKADEGATICLTANGQIIGFDMATGDTQAIAITPQEIGTTVKLTITKQDYYRYEHFIKTISAEEPYLIFDALVINDEEGNGNQAPDYNESCRMGLSLHNVGYSALSNFNVTLTCNHPEVEITQSNFEFNGMDADETQLQNDAFNVHFGDKLLDQEKVKFYMQMKNEDYTFNDSVTVTIKAPNLKFAGLSITDLEGNVTDRLMVGQSSYLTFNLDNQGESKSKEISNRFNLMAPYINVDEDEVTIPAIEAGATGQVTFRAHVNEDAVDGIINYQLQAESGYHNTQIESHINLGYITEGFEGESLSEDIQWSFGSGSKKWTIAEDSTAFGGHCLRSASINNNASSNINIGFNADMADTFSFYHKTSTEEGDRLILTLNGKEMDSWSGISDWERSEYELRPGSNVIKFTYKKNGSDTDGEDAVMIDELRFPPFAKMVLYAGDDTETCSNDTFTPEGYIYNHTDFAWSTNGDGTFDDAHSEHPTYTFGEADKSEGQVELTLTGTSAHNGSQQSNTVSLSILPTFDPSHTPEMPSGATEIDIRLVNQSEYLGEENSDAVYIWNIEPSTAGTITGEGPQAQVEWNRDYKGQVSINYSYENPCGSTAVSESILVNVFNSTGIDEQGSATVEVYPNPANDMIHIRTHQDGEFTLRVIDLMGKVVYENGPSTSSGTANSGTVTIPTSKFGGSGIYTIQVIQNDVVTNIRVVVMP
jgi:hypothetical protein